MRGGQPEAVLDESSPCGLRSPLYMAAELGDGDVALVDDDVRKSSGK